MALLTPCFWPEVRRGGERYVRELADGLIARGHRPQLITSHPGRTRRSVEDGLPITRLWRPPTKWLDRLGLEQYLTHVPASYAALRSSSCDVAHAHFPTDALAAGRWTKATGRPSILTYHGIPDPRGLDARRLTRRITRKVVAECTAVTAVSKTAADAFERYLGVEAQVIHPGVDLEAFVPALRRSERPTIFSAATPDEARKRVGLLVDAFRLVRRARPDAQLRLLRPRDPAVAARLLAGAAGIELIETVSDPRVLAEEYGRAWASALPSIGDSFGITLIESLACGTPVVASNLDALPEVVDSPEIGRLFDGEEPEPLARALLEALELGSDEGCRAACRRRAEQFSTERCVRDHELLYHRVLGRSAPEPATQPGQRARPGG